MKVPVSPGILGEAGTSGRLREAAETQFVEVKLPSPAATPAAHASRRLELRRPAFPPTCADLSADR